MRAAVVRVASAAVGSNVGRLALSPQAAVFTSCFKAAESRSFATSSADVALRSMPPAAAHLLVNRYALEGTDNVYHVEDWRLYKDFMLGLCSAPLAEVRAFHDAVVEPYESFLKCTSQSRTAIAFHARESGLFANNSLTTLDYPVYHRFMNRAVRNTLTDAEDMPRLREVIDWALGLKVATGEQLACALITLLIQRKYDLARWLVDTGAVCYKVNGTKLVRAAIHQGQLELAQLIYDRAKGLQHGEDTENIVADLQGTGFWEWKGKPLDLSEPIFAWAASLPEIRWRLDELSCHGKAPLV